MALQRGKGRQHRRMFDFRRDEVSLVRPRFDGGANRGVVAFGCARREENLAGTGAKKFGDFGASFFDGAFEFRAKTVRT